ncbi:FAD-dependent oxidoreductase [Verrucomicrobiaceae bacterium 5K15]|uniref:FAD-dependent oxidoreductase n=1 Tax=Oceaniferula flava TaxID=2800421 RepID=A0AAE2SBZ4_9BACT|nr:FAD-dependent oxidoreductase [Oceaniferula flavus]MBK1854222.1 FAD-dependent oxidoreductase [Oceaniferula flavus]MBM1135528.1 FAD-dependent oxidoreductase [Oceaniferula flavus]
MEKKSDSVVVVGAGIIGLCTAYSLLKAGRAVTIIDREGDSQTSCSYGNAGMVVPSHFIPLAAPGIIAKGLRWLANPEGPFYIRPRMSMDLVRWCRLFSQHATAKHVDASCELIRDLNLESRRLFTELAKDLEVELVEKGLLMLCNSEKTLHEEAEVAEMANRLGVGAEVCDAARLKELDKGIQMDVKGGVWFKDDCHMDPATMVTSLRAKVKAMGAEFMIGAEVSGLSKGSNGMVKLEGVDLPDDQEIVLACGAWSGELMKTMGHRMPMQAGKGYSLTMKNPRELPELCSILCEAKVAVTPMGGALRFGGTMEICGNDLSVNPRRVHGIVKSVSHYFPNFQESDFAGIEPWAGLRPCSPDGLPYIGRVAGSANLTVASGHSMMGLSMGPVTGQVVAEILTSNTPPLDIRKLDPLRFN